MTDFFERGFDEPTRIKLGLYEKYLEEFLGVWIARNPSPKVAKEIDIYDFFAGPGRDEGGYPGSPIVAFEVIRRFAPMLAESGQKVRLWLSDSDLDRVSCLKQVLGDPAEWPEGIKVDIHNMEFSEALNFNRERLGRKPGLIFADQFGVKYITPDVFQYIAGLRATDLIFFISSSAFGRFSEHENIRKYHHGIGEYLAGVAPEHIHRKVKDYYQSLIPDSSYRLAPFSLKKGPNIYGLIFGTGHISGMRKFLDIVWKLDEERGEANFDLDNDQLPKESVQLQLIEDDRLPKKVEAFQEELQNMIISGYLKTDKQVHEFSIYNGFRPTFHAKPILINLKEAGKIEIEGKSIRLGPQCCKEPRRITLLR